MMHNSPDHDAWIAEARSVSIRAELERRGLWTKRMHNDGGVPCPACGGEDRFAVNEKKGVFQCRGSAGGDAIALAEHLDGGSFLEAVETVTGRPSPSGAKREVTESERAERERVMIQRRAGSERRDERAAQAELEKKQSDTARIDQILKSWREFQTSPAQAYLRARGIVPANSFMADIGFVENEPYWGFENERAERKTLLARLPCMVSIIREVEAGIIGIHRTFLDARKPAKFEPPKHRENKPKRILGASRGGMIRFGFIEPVMATGEGIETTLAWFHLGRDIPGVRLENVGLFAAISLGNLSGACSGTIPHPKLQRPDGKPVPIPNGIPDMGRPGVILPSEVKGVMILGDGDSEPYSTKARLLAAGRRFRAEGREVWFDRAPDGMDWNDCLQRQGDRPHSQEERVAA